MRLQLLALLGAEPQHLRRDKRADAIVARAGDVDVAAELLPADDVGDEIADGHALFRVLFIRRADVDEELMQLRHFLFLAALHMNRERADDAKHLAVAAVDVDALSAREARVMPADAAEINEPVLVDVGNLERDFVRMTLDHDLGRATGVERRDDVAVGIALDLVRVRLHVIEPDALAAGLVAGGRGGV